MNFSSYASDLLKNYVSWGAKYIQITAFALTFLAIVILVSLLGKFLTKIAKTIALGLINKIFGGLFGALKIALALSFILFFFNRINSTIPFVKKETIDNSLLYKPVSGLALMVFPYFLEAKRSSKKI